MPSGPDCEHYDTVIIGCGMAGLAAGIRLAMYDRSVLIIERHNAPGGLNGFYAQNGRKFDVGLHAVTNYVDAGVKGTPLGKLLRQLRIGREQLDLCPQLGSRIAFPGADLRFSNNIELLESEVAATFPHAVDEFRRLRRQVLEHNEFDMTAKAVSARKVVAEFVSEPLLREMLFCPLMYYGSAREDDMDWDQFVIMWKALFEEGFARPLEGVRVIIRALLERFRAVGGKRRMKCGVRRILTEGERAVGVELDDGSCVRANHILSTAGRVETDRMFGGGSPESAVEPVGKLSFVESITVLEEQPADLGWDETIVFFNDQADFVYRAPDEEPVDLRSGVICFPNNYAYGPGRQLDEGFFRVTALASYPYWAGLEETAYLAEKDAWYVRMQAAAQRFLPVPAKPLVEVTRATDMFTPRTVHKFTGHLNGAIYGSPEKVKTGRTSLENVYLAGTDQGFLGIIGAMLSGISMVNFHILR